MQLFNATQFKNHTYTPHTKGQDDVDPAPGVIDQGTDQQREGRGRL